MKADGGYLLNFSTAFVAARNFIKQPLGAGEAKLPAVIIAAKAKSKATRRENSETDAILSWKLLTRQSQQICRLRQRLLLKLGGVKKHVVSQKHKKESF